VAATAVAAFAAVALVLTRGDGAGSVAAVLTFAALGMAAEALGQGIYGSTTVSLSAIPVVAAAAAGEPAAALVTAAVAGLTTTAVARSRRPAQYLFNPAALVLCATVAIGAFAVSPSSGLPALVAAGLLAGLAYFALDNALVAVAAGMDSGRSPREVFRSDLSWLLPSFMAYGVLGAVLGFAWDTTRGWGVLAFLVPPLLVRLGQRQYLRRTGEQVERLSALAEELTVARAAAVEASEAVTELHRQTAAALAEAIDARDAGTGGHVDRVTVLGQALLEAAAPELAADPQLAFAFLLHDVGKIGVPDAILGKPGELTMAERAVMDGLAGTEIPVAARLFAVVDAIDAMTSDRPYRRGMSLDAAFAELQRGAGGQFDPAAVEALTGLGTDRVRNLLGLPDVITLPDAVPHQAGSVPTWSSMPA
jgi:ribonuclease P protein subunit RPR2